MNVDFMDESTANTPVPFPAPLFYGLLTSQIIATLFVHLSNQSIYSGAVAVKKAGFLPIPAGQVLASLQRFETAFWGGLFYTLSTGVGLALITWSALRIWELLFKQNTKLLMGCFLVWIGLLITVNTAGVILFPSLFFILVPLATGWATLNTIKKRTVRPNRLWFLPVVTLVLLTVLWATQFDRQLFISIRDQVLLSNPVGRSVNDFYYRYTLYAAEAFKSIDQKTVKTCRLENVTDEGMARKLKIGLARHDILVVPEMDHADIVLALVGGKMELKSATGNRIETTFDQFRKSPRTWVSRLSKASDRYAPFRKMTFFGLLLGFPTLLFMLVHGLLHYLLRLMVRENRAAVFASALCAVIGVLLFLPMLGARPVVITRDNLNAELTSDRWPHRVAALRYIDAHNVDLALFPAYKKMLVSALVVERYWLARALAKSHSATTYADLLTLLQDRHPNVICQVFYALGERGRAGAIEPIQKKLIDSNHWYAQWYGYRALRKLGWHQRPLN